MSRLACLVLLCILVVLCLPGCGPAPLAVPSPEAATAVPASSSVEEPAPNAIRLAAFFPWEITDGDYNNMGYVALLAVKSGGQVDTTYLQSVDPADLRNSMQVMAGQGYTVLWVHGSQFNEQALEFARQNPLVVVIVEQEGELPQRPPNVWVIDRNFHQGFYVLGALAARATGTGRVAYLAGMPLEYSYIEAHAVEQAIADAGGETQLEAVWTNDFNDAGLARRATDRLISGGVDFVIGSLNQGIFGVLEAASTSSSRVLVTSKYSDKTSYAPDHHVTTLLYDFSAPLAAILARIEAGETGGVYSMAFGEGISLLLPLHNVEPDLQAELETIIAAIQAGEIEVQQDSSPFPENR